MKRDFLRLADLSEDEVHSLINRSIEMKGGKDAGSCPIIGRSVGLLFEKSSTRTRVSFEVGIYQLGGQPVAMNIKDIQLDRGETIADTARTLSRFLHAIAIRTHEHSRIEEFARHAEIPVINALTDTHHPCQALADLLTIFEKKGGLKGLKVAYVGDGNNVANSLVEAAVRTGLELVLACPEGYEPAPDALKSGGNVKVVSDPKEAAEDADVLYTDVWVSMGQEDEEEERIKAFGEYQINSGLMALAKDDAIVMHCLPAHRGMEITDEVLDGPRSVVFEQAENRLHAQKALLEFLLT
jgi:ornithine carbamoyltransferase